MIIVSYIYLYPVTVKIKSSRSSKASQDHVSAEYIVRGVALGRTPLQLIANQKTGRLISSQAQEIQVFPPLRLEPRNITLIVGAQFQVCKLCCVHKINCCFMRTSC
jgi:nuclear pore complex protein Nup210